MDKATWDHIFLFAHMLGIGLILSLPISAHMIKGAMANPDFPLRAKAAIAAFLINMDNLARSGAAVLLITGIGLMWTRSITIGDLFTSRYWALTVVFVLFALVVVMGYFFAAPAIRQGMQVLREATTAGGPPSQEQMDKIARARRYISITGIPQISLLTLTVIFAAFAAHLS